MSILSAIKDKIFGVSKTETAPTKGTDVQELELSAPISQVDVVAILDNLKSNAKEELHWKTSIVDLMKLLSLDSSISARKELAKELNYQGDTGDSASMNIWLHKQVMTKLAQNGGKVPNELIG